MSPSAEAPTCGPGSLSESCSRSMVEQHAGVGGELAAGARVEAHGGREVPVGLLLLARRQAQRAQLHVDEGALPGDALGLQVEGSHDADRRGVVAAQLEQNVGGLQAELRHGETLIFSETETT